MLPVGRTPFKGLQQSNDIFKHFYWKVASVFLYLFLPLAGLTIIWKRHEIWAKLYMNIDHYYLPVAFHSFGKRKLLLNWAKQRLPPNWSSCMETLSGGVADFWNDGSLLCTLINTAVPGACPNPYRHWQKTPAHAQDVAYKYLGLVPIFSEADFSSSLTPYMEKKLLDYLAVIQQSISKLEKVRLFHSFISNRYVVRGMGLYTAEQFKESEFFIYSKIQNSSFYNVEILILGPYSTYYRTTVLESLLKESKRWCSDTKIDGDSKVNNSWRKAKECYLDKLRHLNDSERTNVGNIEIKVALEYDRVKVSYISYNYGIHEVSLSCNKEVIIGSPFYVNILKSLSESTENENKIKKEYECINFNDDGEQYASTSKQNEVKLNSNSSKDNTQSNKGNIKYLSKIQNEFNETRNNKNATEILETNAKHNLSTELTTSNSFNCSKEGTLQISKYLKDLNNMKTVNLDNKQETDNPLYFAKENYLSFQRVVDLSFRRSCRITRNIPRLVQRNYSVVSGASPICTDHTVPEDLGKLTAEEKRKKFADNCKTNNHKSSLFSTKENRQDAANNDKEMKNIKQESISSEKTSSSTQINKNFNRFTNTNINKNNINSNLHRIVTEKKLFWENVIQNCDQKNIVQDVKTLTNNNSKSDISGEKNFENKEIALNEIQFDKTEKLALSPSLKHVDSLRLYRTGTFSKSFVDLRYTENKKKMLKYKSLDENLDKCCNISLDSRTRIYLDHISSFNSKLKEGIRRSVKFAMDKPSTGIKVKQPDDVSLSLNMVLLNGKKITQEWIKMTLKKRKGCFKDYDSDLATVEETHFFKGRPYNK